jgi:hypothetical protein
MKATRIIIALGLAFGLSACGTSDLASRNVSMNTTDLAAANVEGAKRLYLAAQYDVREIRIDVPRDLKVSEANMFYPSADIVWRGEPRGDRYQQVHSIFTDAFGMATAKMKDGPPVMIVATVTRFHGVTEKTRYTVGGVFNMKFDLSVINAETGEVIEATRPVEVNVAAAGGSAAIAEEQAGRTQRVVVIEALRQGVRQEVSRKYEESATSRGAIDPTTLAAIR